MTSLQSSAERPVAGSQKSKTSRHRIVIDTSTLISAIFFGGRSERVLRHIAATQELILSDYIIEELTNFTKNTLPKTSHRTVNLIRKTFEQFVYSFSEREVQVRDINDIPVLQLAIEYRAIVVASDKDLLEYKDDTNIVIISPSEYEELFM